MGVFKFEDLIGKRLAFYGADEKSNRFRLGNRILKVVEDESDGYRSYFSHVEEDMDDVLASVTNKLAMVQIQVASRPEKRTSDDPVSCIDSGYQLVDNKGHVWLEFGTDNEDDYYPSFRFSYNPKEN